MKVFIAGATGVLGRRLVRRFRDRGHTALALVRDPQGEQMVRSLGGEGRWGDLFDADSLARAAEGSDVVIHAATSIPLGRRAAASDWEANDRIRREGTHALTRAAAEIRANLYLQQSVVWVARPPDGSSFVEDSPARPGHSELSAVDGENIAREAGERHGFDVAVLRCGWFYGADSAHTRLFGEGLVKRRIPIIGRGDAFWSPLHLDDAAEAFVAAAEAGRAGLWHVVDDGPVRVAEFLSGFAERLDAPPPRRVPVWVARLLAGSYATDFFTASTKTLNVRFKEAVGWSPRFPSYREGLDQVVATWESEGASWLPTRKKVTR